MNKKLLYGQNTLMFENWLAILYSKMQTVYG